MPRSITRPARWHLYGDCSLRRLTPEQFDYHDLVVNASIPLDRLPVVEAFEVRDDQIDVIIGIVWSAAYRIPPDPARRTRNWRWQYVNQRYQVDTGPMGGIGLRNRYWWTKTRVVEELVGAERRRRRSQLDTSSGAEALADFYI